MSVDVKAIFKIENNLDTKGKNFLDIITTVLEKNNLPGFDYLEFKQSLDALEKMNLDKSTAIKSAYATAATVGLTKEKLLKTADHYRGILAKEKSDFEDAMQNQIQLKIEGKRKDVEALKTKIASYKKEIDKLEMEINKSQTTIDSSDKHIQLEESKIAETKTSFESIYRSILEIISKDIESFNQYL